jgi:NAD(P)-dependent dehydrogenase (short-subunit alcohol dehydrogenase family)/uncharacterized OB-fold protein
MIPPRTRQPLLPPGARSRAALGLTAAAALGRFKLQVCAVCGAVQYPPREACHRCLSDRLPWQEQPGTGELISETTMHHSNDSYFEERLPWRVGLVRLDAGPTAVVHLHGACAPAPSRVRVGARLDKSGQGVLLAFPIDEVPSMADDRQLREMTCDPKLRKVLVTDGTTQVGQAVARAVIGAGAQSVWVGYADAWTKAPEAADLAALPQVTLLPLNLTDSQSVKRAAADVGAKVDILINTGEVHHAIGSASREGIDSRDGIEGARAEMDVNYFGLLRLAQEFGPAMRSRGAQGQSSAAAWVNLLSVYALSNYPPHGTYSASKAAALSLAQCLRAEMRSAGVRVINVFPGPIDDEWNRMLPPPKLTAGALAKAVVSALQDGVEDVYPGDLAQQWLARWVEDPKLLEQDLSV